ncbi:hypothetical protein BGX33_012635 [Mortierella sp. NVP41]|nr:hypothetical protein BGX33_012635 [Mortierella sp. NVP41]
MSMIARSLPKPIWHVSNPPNRTMHLRLFLLCLEFGNSLGHQRDWAFVQHCVKKAYHFDYIDQPIYSQLYNLTCTHREDPRIFSGRAQTLINAVDPAIIGSNQVMLILYHALPKEGCEKIHAKFTDGLSSIEDYKTLLDFIREVPSITTGFKPDDAQWHITNFDPKHLAINSI